MLLFAEGSPKADRNGTVDSGIAEYRAECIIMYE